MPHCQHCHSYVNGFVEKCFNCERKICDGCKEVRQKAGGCKYKNGNFKPFGEPVKTRGAQVFAPSKGEDIKTYDVKSQYPNILDLFSGFGTTAVQPKGNEVRIPVCKKCFREMVPLEWRLRNGVCPMCKLKEELKGS